MNYYLGVDLGGTNIAVGLVDENEQLICKKSTPTPKKPSHEELTGAIENLCREFLAENNLTFADVRTIGIGAPSQIEPTRGELLFACNLHIRNLPLGQLLTERTGVKTYVCNDADAAAFGEAKAGAAKGYNSCVAVTLGTGVGTGVVMGSDIVPSEGGHHVIVYGGKHCNCGRNGCYEVYASATALIEQTRTAMQSNKESLLWKVAGDLEHVNGRTVFDAMDMGDETAKQVYDQYMGYVACGLANIANNVAPEAICIGGGISGQGERLTAPLNEYLQREQQPLIAGGTTKVLVCTLGNDAGIIGAALYAKYR